MEIKTIRYLDSLDAIQPCHLAGFFDGWATSPDPDRHLAILAGSSHIVLAWDEDTTRVVGFINSLSDGNLMAFIPLLEVLKPYRGHGIGSTLVRRMLERLDGHYAIDVVCDADVMPFYQRHGLRPGNSMMKRNYGWASVPRP